MSGRMVRKTHTLGDRTSRETRMAGVGVRGHARSARAVRMVGSHARSLQGMDGDAGQPRWRSARVPRSSPPRLPLPSCDGGWTLERKP
jgi:hypothetical protein